MFDINARIVSKARSFINTPFHLQARQKGVGIDCIGLIVEVANEMKLCSQLGGLLKSYDIKCYSISNHNDLLIKTLDKHLIEVPQLNFGAVAVFKNNTNYHVGIIGDYKYGGFSLIHSCLKAGKVVEHKLAPDFQKKIFKIYKFLD